MPLQLSKNMDASVKRYRFGGVIERKRSYLDLSSPIERLEKTKLVSRCYPIDCEPESPLSAYRKENYFKLFLFDIGVLGHMLDIRTMKDLILAFEGVLSIPQHWPFNTWKHKLEKKADSLFDQLQPEASPDWIELPPDTQETTASASWHIELELPGGVVLRMRP